MNYYLYKLHFDGAVHFGEADSAMSLQSSSDHFCADTLFSALCHTAGRLWGSAAIETLCEQVKAGKLLLSDSMPWRSSEDEDIYYLPKPCAVSRTKQEVPAELRKAMKRLAWIPVPEMVDFQSSLEGRGLYCPHEESFGIHEVRTIAAVNTGKDATPYQVSAYRFMPSCGLYFLAGCADEAQAQWLEKLIYALGTSGVGGKVSTGYGTFSIKDTILLNKPFDAQTHWLYDALTKETPKHYLLLTTSLPTDDELDGVLSGAFYQITRRGGYVQSETFSATPQRKRTQYFFSAGTMLERPFAGALYNAADAKMHPVYRYSKPMMLGVGF